MADQTAGEMPETTTGAMPDATGETPVTTQTENQNQTTTEELEQLRAQLRKANKESAERRKLLEQYQTAEEQRKQTELSEQERLQQQVQTLQQERDALQQSYSTLERRQQAADALGSAGVAFANANARSDALRLLLESDGDDWTAAVKQLQKDRPYLFQAPQPAPDINAGSRGNAQLSAEEKEKELFQRFPRLKMR